MPLKYGEPPKKQTPHDPSNDPVWAQEPMYRNWVQYQAMVVSEAVYDDEQKRGPDQGVYFHKGDNNSERFLIHVIGTTAFVAFCGTKDQSHFMELQEFELESINEGSELKAMKGYLKPARQIPLMVEAFEPSGIKHLVLTGHSRGGSIAFIKLAMYFINPHTNLNSNMVVEAIAFGSPYCFNGAVSMYLDDMKLQPFFTTFAHRDDAVPCVFWAFGKSQEFVVKEILGNILQHLKLSVGSATYGVARIFGYLQVDITKVSKLQAIFKQYDAVGRFKILGTNQMDVDAHQHTERILRNMSASIDHTVKVLVKAHSCANYLEFVTHLPVPNRHEANLNLCPRIYNYSGALFVQESETSLLKLTIYGENLLFLARKFPAEFNGRKYEFEMDIASYSMAEATCGFTSHIKVGSKTMKILLKCPFLPDDSLNHMIDDPFEFFPRSPTLKRLLLRAFKLRKLCDEIKTTQKKSKNVKGFAFNSEWITVCTSLKELEGSHDIPPPLYQVVDSCIDKLTQDLLIQYKLHHGLKSFLDGYGPVAVGGSLGGFAVASAATMLGYPLIVSATVFYVALALTGSLAMWQSEMNVMPLLTEVVQTGVYDRHIQKICYLLELNSVSEDSLAKMAEKEVTDMLLLKNVTSTTSQQIRSRIKLIRHVNVIRRFMETVKIVGIVGLEKAGKTKSIKRLFKHVAQTITSQETEMHTTYPVPYKCNSFFVLDFPGMGGNNEFGKFTAQFAEICTNIVVFLPPRMNLQQADIDVLQKVQAFEARVLVLLHRWGTTSADDINFTDTKRILDAAGSKFRKFDFHLSELDPGYWEDYKKSFLREKDVWDIKKVREWIRSMALLKDFDELPDSNAIWDNSCNQWVDKITDGQAIMKEIIDNALEDFEYLDIFVTMRKEWTLDCLDCGVWNAQLCKKALIQAEGSRNGAKTILKRQECARRLAVNGISEEELLQFQFLDLIISMKQEWSTKEGQWNTKTCMNALRESAGSRAEALRCLQREERLRHLVEDGISLEQLLQFKYLESLESMKKDWSEDDGVWNVRRCMQALEKSNGNLKKAYIFLAKEE